METTQEIVENHANAMQSPEIGKLSEALAKAQAEMEPAVKDSSNPFFKSQYASLASCWQACRGPLSKNGLAVIQTTEPDNGNVTVISTLTHSSGQWIKGKLSVKPAKTDSQALGSCLSYLRRYSLSALVGLSTQDDDGEGTMPRNNINEKIKTNKFMDTMTAMKKKLGGDMFQAVLDDRKITDLATVTAKNDQIDLYNEMQKLTK